MADIEFVLNAIDAGFQKTMKEAQAQGKETAESIKASFESISGAIKSVTGVMAAFAAVVAGGEMFKEMIASTVRATSESVGLAKQMGISATEASQLKVAMGAVFVSQDAVATANNKITQTLKTNSQAFTDLGVATRNSDGSLRSSMDIMMDVNEQLMKFTEGTSRNVEGAKIYGRAWSDVQSILKLTPEVLQEAKIKANELGLAVGTDDVAAAKRFRAAQNEVHEVIEAVGKVIATAVMPALSSLGEWFGDIGPNVVNTFRASIAALTSFFILLRETVYIVFDTMIDSFGVMVQAAIAAGNIIKAAFTPGASISEAWKKETSAVAASFKQFNDDIAADVKQAEDGIDSIVEKMGPQFNPTARAPTGKTSVETESDDARMAKLQLELAQQKEAWAKEQDARGTFIEFSKQQELDFWQSKIGIGAKNSALEVAIEKNALALRQSIRRDGYEAELADIKASAAQYKTNLEAKLAIAIEAQKKIAAAEGGDSKAAKQAGAEILAFQREIAAQTAAIATAEAKQREAAALAGVDAEEKQAELRVAIGLETNDQLLEQQQSFENRRYQIKLAELRKEQTTLGTAGGTGDTNKAAIQQNNAAIEALETQHAARMQQIANKMTLDQSKDWRTLFSNIQSGFASAFASFLKGTATIGQTLKSMFASVGSSIAQALSDIAAKSIATMVEQWVITRAIKMKELMGSAATAAGNAFSATAAIPYVGPFLAPAAAAGAFAAVEGYGSSISAAGGFDIPAGINPIVQTHEKEMILPAKHADVIRSMADDGRRSGGGDSFNVHINAHDSASVAKWANKHQAVLANAVHSHLRATGRAAPAH